MNLPAFMLDAASRQEQYAAHRKACREAWFKIERELAERKAMEEAQAWLDLDAAKSTTD
jgi:hypothetical protein